MFRRYKKHIFPVILAILIGMGSGYLSFNHNFNAHLDSVSREADAMLALTSSYVKLYSNIRSESNVNSIPVPAAFRAQAHFSFEKTHQGNDHFLARMVGPPGNYIATPPTDDTMGEQLSKMAEGVNPDTFSAVIKQNGVSVLRTMYASVATQASCANCHNTIQNLDVPWKKGDIMGAYVIERSVQTQKERYLLYAVMTGTLVTLLLLSVYVAIELYNDLRKRAMELQYLAQTDPLTGCINRRALENYVNELTPDSRDNAAVFMLDIDHFKQVNDNYGHAVGDQVLVWFVEKSRSFLRKNDVIARIGGEEFTVYLPDASEQHARVVAERINNAIASEPFNMNGEDIAITVSIGAVHTSKAPNKGLSLYRKAADVLLYSAKSSGRNRVVWES